MTGIEFLNMKIDAYNMQSAVMNGTVNALSNITENTSNEKIAYINGRLDEYFGEEEEE